MAHPAQKKFVRYVRRKHPKYFVGCNVVDIGSKDINGNNRGFFWFCNYVGVDLEPGRNVDVVDHALVAFCRIRHGIETGYSLEWVDTVISTEALEHDKQWALTLQTMYDNLEEDGLLLITCAGEGREEHGTFESKPEDSPATNDHYQNITNEMFESVLKPSMFQSYFLRQKDTDLQFYGIK
jgi:hypothetical protein